MSTSGGDDSTATVAGYLLSILPKFPAALSMFGSMLIISQVIRNVKNRRQMQQRIVASMSGFDLMVSTVWFFTNFFVPQTMKRSQGFPFAFGNRASCDAQGFLVQVSIASVLYNASLSLYYLLALKYLWRDVRFRSTEKYFHLIPILFGLITAIIAVSMGLIGNADWDCWISPIENSRDTSDSAKLARIFQWVFFFGPLWISMSFAFFNMFQVYYFVKNLELRASTYRMSMQTNQEHHLHYKNLAKQNQLYAIAFLCTWLFPTIARLIQVSGGQVPIWLVVLSGTFIPLQGFFNSLVYFSTKFHNIRQAYKQKRWFWHLALLIKSVIKNQEVNLPQEQENDKNINKLRRGGKLVPPSSEEIRNNNLASNVGMNGRSESIETNDVRFNTKERWNYIHGIDNETRHPLSKNSGSTNVHACSEIQLDGRDANFSSISESQLEDVGKGLSLQSRSSGGLNRIESGASLDSSKGSLQQLRGGKDPDTSLLEAFDPNSPQRRSTSLHILEEGDRSNENSENISQSVGSSGFDSGLFNSKGVESNETTKAVKLLVLGDEKYNSSSENIVGTDVQTTMHTSKTEENPS